MENFYEYPNVIIEVSDIVELTLSPATVGEEIIYQTFSVENTGLKRLRYD